MSEETEERGKRLVALHRGDEAMRAQFAREVRDAIERFRNVAHAARELGVSKGTLHGWIRGNPSLVEGVTMQIRGRPRKPPASPE